MRIRTIIVAMLALVFAAACGAPQRLTHHRSALLYPELKPFVPEGRIAHIPVDMRGGAAAEVRSTKDEDDAAGGDSSGSAVTPSSPEDDPPPVIVSDSDGSLPVSMHRGSASTRTVRASRGPFIQPTAWICLRTAFGPEKTA